ncbi:serine/threonine protein kinase [Stigmatella aurantiaca]|uniref:non-specific serine/threonine protein kinase n=1 Tax=Stigmatella aurantiaca (strain DW4/3-1) TaxID=378806 RepID=Q094A4_STIAD|nr:protein kinase [Stigmatella aurantiaca]ADO70648.1 serine/threonine protein kinase [Stigmatella aurantiaca DW4/3-1]EAU67060.1 protein kinase domain, putative [Stigmatella aurantiaca DW4/3-1]
MSTGKFGIPRGTILFEMDGIQYEFREDLGEVRRGISHLVARQRINGRPGRKVLLKAVGPSSGPLITRILRARAKLEEQVRLAKYLDHPGILRVHGLKKTEEAWYVLTEFPDGNSLSSLINIVIECRRWYTPLFAMYVGARLAEVLEYAHTVKGERGNPLNIVHRAINADHVFLDWNGIVRVSDFGLSLSALPGRVPSTAQRLLGDGFYSSPEMLLSRRIDARADLFSIGVIMLELATGKNLLYAPDELTATVKASLSSRQLSRVKRAVERAQLSRGNRMAGDAVWRAATYTEADVETDTAGLPEGLRMTLRKLLHPELGKRYQTAGELVVDLRHWLGELAFSPADAVEELTRTMDEASARLDREGVEGSISARRREHITTA